jgi:uncharacterized membrane protein
MASFVKRLTQLAQLAKERGVMDDVTARDLVALAEERERERGVLSLSSILGWLGGAVIVLGVILLVAANWEEIGDGTKIAGFVVLLGSTHATGFWIRMSGRPYDHTAEALHFVGAGLFIAGVGLIAQIYNLDARPPNAVLLWLAAVVPLVVLLRSAPVAAMAVFALILWMHMEGSYGASPVRIGSFAGHLVLEVGVGTALVGFSTLVRSLEPAIARVMRVAGAGMLFYAIYMLGFYRYFSHAPAREGVVAWILPSMALVIGALGAWMGWKRLALESAWLRDRLNTFLVLLLVVSAVAVVADAGGLPEGPAFRFFNFGGGDRTFTLMELVVSIAAWVIWFLLAFWCVAFGTRSGRKGYLNAGVIGVGLGVVTRFFDLIGGQTETGMLFVIGGLVLLGTAWGMEKWRRAAIARMGEAR